MSDESRPNRRKKRAKPPLDAGSLEELAIAYVARYATSSGKLHNYLKRKIRERGWADKMAEPPLESLLERFRERGFVTDRAYAQMRSGDLLRRGYGAQRIRQALAGAGIGSEIGESIAPQIGEKRRAVLVMARKRRFGPFSATDEDHALREKRLAAMLRAGHSFEDARAMLDMATEEEAEQWVAEAEDYQED